MDKKTTDFNAIIAAFDELEILYKLSQLFIREFQVSVLNEYRYCARAIIDFHKAQDEGAKALAAQKAVVAISAAYNDILDYLAYSIKEGVAKLREKYWTKGASDIISGKFNYNAVLVSLAEMDALVVESRRDRSNRLQSYIDFSKSTHFDNLKNFALNFSSLVHLLDCDARNQIDDGLISDCIRAAINQPDDLMGAGLVLFFQPKYFYPQAARSAQKSPQIYGAEALIRLRMVKDGIPDLIPPARVLEVAQAAGLIDGVNQFVLDSSIKICKKWLSEGVIGKNFDLSINVNPTQFEELDFHRSLADKMADLEVQNIISIELLEGWDVKKPALPILVAHCLNELSPKTRIHIDDFGTGTTRLAYVTSIPSIDTLKIDKSIVDKINAKNSEPYIQQVKGILAYAQAIGKKVLAEGVETDAQLQVLHDIGIDNFQGFHDDFSKPLNVDDAEKLFVRKGVVNGVH